MSDRKSYPSDVSDKEWTILEPLLPTHPAKGRPWAWSHREMVNALFYVLRTGCAWRQLPHDMPPWQSVYSRFRKWRKRKIWSQVQDVLRGIARECSDRDVEPSALVIDNQSVKTTEKGGSTDTTERRGSRAARGISRWTRRATLLKSMSIPPTSKIARGPCLSSKRPNENAQESKQSSLIWAIPGS